MHPQSMCDEHPCQVYSYSKLRIVFRKLDITSIVLRAIIAVTALSEAVSYYTTRANMVYPYHQ